MTLWERASSGISSPQFGDRRHCDMGDLKILICHVTSHDQVFKGSCDVIGGRPS